MVPYDRWTESREEIGARLAAERGLELVKPYDDPLVMAGQGTVALELLEDAPELDLLPGAGQRRRPDRGLRDRRARRCGPGSAWSESSPRRETTHAARSPPASAIRDRRPATIADGLQATEPGELTFEVNRRLVDEVVTVSDEEIVEAMAFLFDRLKLVAEPSGAVGVAVLLSGKLDARGRSVGIVVSGGNVGAARFAELVSRTSFRAEQDDLDQRLLGPGDGLFIGRQAAEHPRREQLVDRAVDDGRSEGRVDVLAELACARCRARSLAGARRWAA